MEMFQCFVQKITTGNWVSQKAFSRFGHFWGWVSFPGKHPPNTKLKPPLIFEEADVQRAKDQTVDEKEACTI